MDRHEQIKFCRVCRNKSFDTEKGLVCKLTNKPAIFENQCPDFEGDRDDIWKVELAQREEPPNRFIALFVPRRNYFVTPVIADLCILFFIVVVFAGGGFIMPDYEVMLKWGAGYKALTLDGQYWRLITSFFLHFGIIHLLSNIFTLLFIGMLLEPVLGASKFIVVFFFTGLTGSVVSMWDHDLGICAGASGAIFGLFGVYIILLLSNIIRKSDKGSLLTTVIVFVAFGIIGGLRQKGIDNAAHLSGLTSGLIFGISVIPALKWPGKKFLYRLLPLVFMFMVMLLLSTLVFVSDNPVGLYNKTMTEFRIYETRALAYYRLPRYASDSLLWKTLNNEGIPNWERCAALVNDLNSIPGLPATLKDKNYLLRKYCEYQIKSYELHKKAFNDAHTDYNLEINNYNLKINMIQRKYIGENIADSLLEVRIDDFLPAWRNSNETIIVNGKVVKDIYDLNLDQIESVSYLSGTQAEQEFGEKAKNGIIIITTWSN